MTDSPTGPLLAVVAALTQRQRDEIVERFTRPNPAWRGAEAADILDLLADSDSDLGQIEPFFEANPGLAVPGAEVASRALIWSGMHLSAGNMASLLASAGLLED